MPLLFAFCSGQKGVLSGALSGCHLIREASMRT
jgi:hypothetical protein